MRTKRALKYTMVGMGGVGISVGLVPGIAFADQEGLDAAAAVQATLDNVWVLVQPCS